jgi:hypothetical protein
LDGDAFLRDFPQEGQLALGAKLLGHLGAEIDDAVADGVMGASGHRL